MSETLATNASFYAGAGLVGYHLAGILGAGIGLLAAPVAVAFVVVLFS